MGLKRGLELFVKTAFIVTKQYAIESFQVDSSEQTLLYTNIVDVTILICQKLINFL